MKIDAKAYKAAWDTYVEQSFDVALTTGDILRLALEAYEAAKPQPAAPEVVRWLYRNSDTGQECVSPSKWGFLEDTPWWVETPLIAAPPPAPQGDVAEAVAKEREACALIARRRRHNIDKANDYDRGIRATSVVIENEILARAEQKADRAVAAGRAG